MTSKNIYSDTRRPYFYIIKHISSGKRYAGCRYAKGCSPSELLQTNGYITSSSLIKGIIKEHGCGAFEVEEIIEEEDILIPFGWNSIVDYETWFLKSNNCAMDERWLNRHNNWARPIGGTPLFELLMIQKYGVRNPFCSEIIKEKSRKTNLETYGFEYASQSPTVKQKTKETNLENHGVEYPMQSTIIQEKAHNTWVSRYGEDYRTLQQGKSII